MIQYLAHVASSHKSKKDQVSSRPPPVQGLRWDDGAQLSDGSPVRMVWGVQQRPAPPL